MQIKNKKDFWAGLMFVGFGAFFSAVGSQYTIGTAANMGPGYFPTTLGIITILLGILIAISSMSSAIPDERVGKFPWFTILLILGSVVLFGLLLESLGLGLSLFVLIGLSSFAAHDFSWKGMLANAVMLISGSLALFVWALNLQFQLLPTFIGN